MSKLIRRYEMLRDKASSPRSANHGRISIYSFQKYCRHCRAGLPEPKSTGKLLLKWLYRHSYCSESCKFYGPKTATTFVPMQSGTKSPKRPKIYDVEKMAFAALTIERMKSRLSKEQALILDADNNYRLLSEKLRFLEVETGRNWASATFYRKLNIVLMMLP